MLDLYFLLKIGAFQELAIGLTIAFAIAAFGFFIAHCEESVYEDKKAEKYMSYAKFNLKIAAIALLFAVALPSKRDMLLIYGVGGTIDYIKSNDTAKKLPDKAIEALNKLMDDYLNKQDQI